MLCGLVRGFVFDGNAFAPDDPERNADANRDKPNDKRRYAYRKLRFVGAVFADRCAESWLVAVDRNLITCRGCDGGSDEYAEDAASREKHATNHHARIVPLILWRRRTCGRPVVRAVAVVGLISWW